MSKQYTVEVVAADQRQGYSETVEARTEKAAENKVRRRLGKTWQNATYTITEAKP